MNKIANHITSEDATEQTFRSIKFGLCKAMSEFGLSPKEAEEFLQKAAKIDPVEALKNWTLLLSAGGVAAGLGTAALRNKIESTAESSESPEMRLTNARIKAYKKMIENFKEENDLMANQSQGSV